MKRYYLASLSASVLWSASFIGTTIAYETTSALQLGMERTLLAAFLFFILRLFAKNREKLNRGDLLTLALSGLLGTTLYLGSKNIGVELTTSSNAALIVASFPAMTVLLESCIDRVVPPAAKIAGIIIAIAGVALLSGTTAAGSSNQALGNLCLMAAGVFWAIYTMVTRKIAKKYSAMTLTAYQMLFGGLFFIPLALLEGRPWRLPTPTSLAAILFLAVCCSLLAFLLFNYGLQKISAGVSASLMNLMPALGLVFSFVLLHEKISLRQILGGLIVVIGVTLSSVQLKTAGAAPRSPARRWSALRPSARRPFP